MRTLLLAAAAACLAACSNAALPQAASAAPADHEAVAVFAGGCFWCIEAELEAVPGVRTVVSGYTGGTTPDPTYQRMGDHAEAVEVIYDPAEVTYDQLLEVFWSNIDPTDEGGQFYDRGSQYRTAIYVLDDAQAAAARASLEANAKRLSQPIATAVLPASEFYPAEEYHQDYYLKEPERYEAYKKGSRREETLRDVWQTQ
ncbi:MAG: peptide-methionine (S)-S-oxide reductase MsrA [Hyphomonas sp.]